MMALARKVVRGLYQLGSVCTLAENTVQSLTAEDDSLKYLLSEPYVSYRSAKSETHGSAVKGEPCYPRRGYLTNEVKSEPNYRSRMSRAERKCTGVVW